MVITFFVFVGIAVLFFVLLAGKKLLPERWKEKFCALCFAVALTWLTILALYWMGKFDNVVLLALLMGQSVLGIYYTVEKNVKKELHLFRLPFLLTLTSIAYFLVVGLSDSILIITFLAALWLVFLVVHIYKNNRRISTLVDSIVECCKRW